MPNKEDSQPITSWRYFKNYLEQEILQKFNAPSYILKPSLYGKYLEDEVSEEEINMIDRELNNLHWSLEETAEREIKSIQQLAHLLPEYDENKSWKKLVPSTTFIGDNDHENILSEITYNLLETFYKMKEWYWWGRRTGWRWISSTTIGRFGNNTGWAKRISEYQWFIR